MADSSKAQPSRRQHIRHLARSTFVVMLAFLAAKVISLFQTLIIAQTFGVGRDLDAYVAANRIPELIVILISGGALTHAFIPVFSGFLAKGDLDSAWKLSSHLINSIFTLALALSALVFVFAPWLVDNAVAPGFDAATARSTVDMMRILLLSTIIFAVSGIFSGILNSHQHFLLPALAPIMFDIGILIGVLFFLPRFGINGLAWGAVLGAGLHFSIQIPGLVRYKMRWRLELGWDNPQLWRVIRLMLPRIGGLGVFSLNFLVMNNIASRLGAGSVSALDWGWRLMQIPQTLIGTAMGIVIFPTLAALSELDDLSGKRPDALSARYNCRAMNIMRRGAALAVLGLILGGLHGWRGRGARADPERGDAPRDTDGDALAHADTHSHADTFADSHALTSFDAPSDAYCRAESHAHTDVHALAHFHTHANSRTDTGPNADTRGLAYALADRHAVTDPDRHPNTDTEADPALPGDRIVGDVPPDRQAAYRAAMADVVAYYADRYGVETPEFGVYMGADLEAVRAAWGELGGSSPETFRSAGRVTTLQGTRVMFIYGNYCARRRDKPCPPCARVLPCDPVRVVRQ